LPQQKQLLAQSAVFMTCRIRPGDHVFLAAREAEYLGQFLRRLCLLHRALPDSDADHWCKSTGGSKAVFNWLGLHATFQIKELKLFA